MAGRARSWTAHLALALALMATARCSAGQQPQQPGSASKLLREIISSTVEAAIDPIAAELRSQRTLLDSIVASLDTIKAGQVELKAGQAALNADFDTLKTGLDTLKAGQVALNVSTDTRNARTNSSVAAALQARPPRDCSDLPTGARTGIYTLQLGRDVGDLTDAAAFCDMDIAGGGWTVIQRRSDILPRYNFYRNWAAYRQGFGNISGEFWWGLEKMWLLTSSEDRRYELRIDLQYISGERVYALYQGFAISSYRDGYRLTGGNYSGDAEDNFSWNLGHRFSTRDRDADPEDSVDCAQRHKGGWWYSVYCGTNNLNGVHGGTATDGVWWGWGGHLKTVEMKVRPDDMCERHTGFGM